MAGRQALIVDACTALNVLATRKWSEIFAVSGFRPAMSRSAAQEALWIRDEAGEREQIDLSPLVRAGQLEIWDLVDDEVSEMLRLVVRLGRGESSCLALARSRKAPLASDDGAAVRQARVDPVVPVVTTSRLMRAWSSTVTAPQATAALLRIEQGAAFWPAPGDPDAAWWRDLVRRQAA